MSKPSVSEASVRSPSVGRPGRYPTGNIVGLAIIGALAAWTLLAAAASGGNPWPPVALIVVCGGAFIAASRIEHRRLGTAPAVVVVIALGFVVVSPLGTFAGGAGEGPFGYANAKAAFFVLAAIAAVMVAIARPKWRWFSLALVVTFSLVPFLSDARAAAAVVATVGVLGPAAMVAPLRRFVAPLAGAAFLSVLAFTVWMAATPRPPDELVGRFDARRVMLWGEAFDTMAQRPLVGVGPGRFGSIPSTARRDADARWAHHDFLEQGAEIGIVGGGLLVLLFLWGIARAGTIGSSLGVLAALAAGALGTLASVDHLLHFPLIPLSAAVLVGGVAPLPVPSSATARRQSAARTGIKLAALPLGIWTRRRPGDVVILLYHRVGTGDREIDLPIEGFERQMVALSERERILSLDEALRGEDGGVVVTFDDGFADFHHHVVPVLDRLRIPTMLYLSTGLVEDGPEALSWGHLREAVASGLVTVGSHTHRHVDLSKVDGRAAEEEMRRSKDLIEDRLGQPCRHFAYPWAVGSDDADRVARRLFDSAALGAWVTNRAGRIDHYRLGRTPVLRSDNGFLFRAKLKGMLDGEALAYRLVRRGPWRPT